MIVQTSFCKGSFLADEAYHTPLLYQIHLMSVERMLERFVTKKFEDTT